MKLLSLFFHIQAALFVLNFQIGLILHVNEIVLDIRDLYTHRHRGGA